MPDWNGGEAQVRKEMRFVGLRQRFAERSGDFIANDAELAGLTGTVFTPVFFLGYGDDSPEVRVCSIAALGR